MNNASSNHDKELETVGRMESEGNMVSNNVGIESRLQEMPFIRSFSRTPKLCS